MKSHILQIKDEQGIWKSNNEDLKTLAVSHFQHIFADSTD